MGQGRRNIGNRTRNHFAWIIEPGTANGKHSPRKKGRVQGEESAPKVLVKGTTFPTASRTAVDREKAGSDQDQVESDNLAEIREKMVVSPEQISGGGSAHGSDLCRMQLREKKIVACDEFGASKGATL